VALNPILKELGFTKEDKVVIIHADDVGINHSSVEAFKELNDLGTISSGSAMVPSSWFPELVGLAKNNPQWDLGLHLAFNGEYETYKWRPISTHRMASGFVDENAYFIEDKKYVEENADPLYVAKEIYAQIRVARSLGLEPSHVDTHSGTLWNKRFTDLYTEIYYEKDIIPVLFKPKQNKTFVKNSSVEMDTEKITKLEKTGFPLIDGVSGMPVEHTYDIDERFDLAKYMLKSIEPGKLIHFAFHPMKDSPEARALRRYTGGRIGDFEVFRKKEMKSFLEEEGIHLTNYREITEAVRRLK